MIALRGSLIAILLIAGGSGLSAQQRSAQPPRVHLELDGLYRGSTQTMSDGATPMVHAETGALATEYEVPTGLALSGGASFRFWRSIAAGVSISRKSASFPAAVSGSIPHPFQFNRPRSFEGTVDGLEREELALGVHLRGVFALSPRVTLSVSAGPARLTLKQDVVTAIQYADSYPFETATFSAAQIATDKLTKWGVSAGADVAYYFNRNAGLGLGFKYSGATADLVSLGDGPLTTRLGGNEIAGGVRLRF